MIARIDHPAIAARQHRKRICEHRSVIGKDCAGGQGLDDCLGFLCPLGHQRIGGGNRGVGDAHVGTGDTQDRVFEAVFRQDQQRPVRPQSHRKQGRTGSARLPARFGIADPDPMSVVSPAGDPGAFGRFIRPFVEIVGQQGQVIREIANLPHVYRTVIPFLIREFGRPEAVR